MSLLDKEEIEMKTGPKITKVSVTTFEHELENVGKDYNTFNMVRQFYRPHVAELPD